MLKSACLVAEGLGSQVVVAMNKSFSYLELSLSFRLTEPGIS